MRKGVLSGSDEWKSFMLTFITIMSESGQNKAMVQCGQFCIFSVSNVSLFSILLVIVII